MKRKKFFLLLILIGIIFCGVAEFTPGPEECIEKFVESTNNLDFYGVTECCDSVTKNALQAALKISSSLGNAYFNGMLGTDFNFEFEEYVKVVPFLKWFLKEEIPVVEADIISTEYEGGIYEWIKQTLSVEIPQLGKLLADSAVVKVKFTSDGEVEEVPVYMKRDGIDWVIDIYRDIKMRK